MVRIGFTSLSHHCATLIGIYLGFKISIWLSFSSSFEVHPTICNDNRPLQDVKIAEENVRDDLVFIGVMTAAKYLDNRAVAVYDTWGKNVPGKLMFFTSESSRTNSNIPIVPLVGVDDVYPPQKKSFLMLKYMHDHYIDDYEWFMRADDDLYVRTDLLEKFLRSVNSDKVQFLGQAGIGSKTSTEDLSLGVADNYCMGGPGMVFSRYTLKKVVPHIKHCLQNLYTTHEDVEIGRCVRKFSNVTCTWAFEMQSLFYHNQEGDKAFSGTLRTPKVLGAITLHPLKTTAKMYRMHNFFNTYQIKHINHQMLKIRRDIDDMKLLLSSNSKDLHAKPAITSSKPSLTSYIPEETDDILTWTMFDQTVYDDRTENPHYRMEELQKTGIYNNIMDLLMKINQYNQQRGRIIIFKSLLYGYLRVNPVHGFNYVLDVLLNYKRYIGKKIILKVRRHAYIQQTLLSPEIREVATNNVISQQASDIRVNLLLPLSGRLQTFYRFMKNVEEVCFQNHQNVELSIILFTLHKDVDSKYLNSVKDLVNNLRNVYPRSSIVMHVVNNKFSRGLALNIGANLYNSKSLLLFIDVDMMFNAGFLDRVRRNTIYNESAYFPIIYSQYNLAEVPKEKQDSNIYKLDTDLGYWRMYGYGIVSIYKSDYDQASGFNENIVGWGLEDVDFVQKVMHTNISIFRSADPGIVHIFHNPYCDPGIHEVQYKMCMGTKLSTLGSVRTLADKLNAYLHKDK